MFEFLDWAGVCAPKSRLQNMHGLGRETPGKTHRSSFMSSGFTTSRAPFVSDMSNSILHDQNSHVSWRYHDTIAETEKHQQSPNFFQVSWYWSVPTTMTSSDDIHPPMIISWRDRWSVCCRHRAGRGEGIPPCGWCVQVWCKVVIYNIWLFSLPNTFQRCLFNLLGRWSPEQCLGSRRQESNAVLEAAETSSRRNANNTDNHSSQWTESHNSI